MTIEHSPAKPIRSFLDSPALPTVLVFALAGCLAVYTASFHSPHPFHFALRQSVWFGAGCVVLLVCRQLSPERLTKLIVPLTVVSLLALVLVLVIGTPHNGMRGWFRLPLLPTVPSLRYAMIQPSELTKPIFVLGLTGFLARFQNRDTRTLRDFWLLFAVALPWFALIALQPDFGTLLIYGLTFAALYWLNGGKPTHLALAAGLAAGLAAIVYFQTPYVRARVAGFLEPAAHADGAAWHVQQQQIALARGGVWGRSIDDPLWSHNYVPLSHTDSMFATLGEVLGFVGVVAIIAAIVLWLLFGLRQANRCDDRFAALTISGLTLMVGIQAVIHVSVCLGLLPPTGVTLPFLSYGGSSLVATMATVGLVLACRPQTADAINAETP